MRHPIEARKGYWTFTKNKLRNQRRLAGGSKGSGVSLDPDFAHRQAGAGSGGNDSAFVPNSKASARTGNASSGLSALEMEDASYEKAVWRFLFECARHGRLDLCFELCKEMGHSWKAASLRGGMLYSNPSLSLDPEADEDAMMEGDSSGSARAVGNRKRALWKLICRKLASEEQSADAYERALYGALGGELSAVLNVSHTWEEHMWAYVNASFEAKLDAFLRGSEPNRNPTADSTTASILSEGSGSWWYGKEGGAGPQAEDASGLNAIEQDGQSETNAALSLRSIFERLEQTSRDGVHAQALEPFRTFQRYLILNELDLLLISTEENLRLARTTLPRGQYAQLVRFFAHYILSARLIDEKKGESEEASSDRSTAAQLAANGILRAYVELLEEAGQEDDLVALYASSLDTQNAIDSYAQYLRSLDLQLDIASRRQALLRAKEHDLDAASVARRTVALIFDELFPVSVIILSIREPRRCGENALTPLCRFPACGNVVRDLRRDHRDPPWLERAGDALDQGARLASLR